MADNYRRPYFEACLFIAWLQDEVKDGVPRGEIVQHLFELARRGQFRIYTSTLSLAEVHKTDGKKAQGEEDDYILALMESEFFVFIDLDRNLGEEANRYCRLYSLNPCDAIHLASADRAGCDVLLTWDTDLLRVKHPRVSTEKPKKIGQLFMDAKMLESPSAESLRQL